MGNDDSIREARVGLEISKRAAEQKPRDTRVQMDLAQSYYRFAKLHESSGNWADAMRCYKTGNDHAIREARRGLEISKRAAKQKPCDTRVQMDLVQSYYTLAKLHESSGNWADAMRCYKHPLEILERLARQTPPDAYPYYAELAAGYWSLGNLHRRVGDWYGALSCHASAREVSERVARERPHDTHAQIGLALARSQFS